MIQVFYSRLGTHALAYGCLTTQYHGDPLTLLLHSIRLALHRNHGHPRPEWPRG